MKPPLIPPWARSRIPPQAHSFARRLRDAWKWSEFRGYSYSQEGEDKILDRLLGNRATGFYVDVGAHHPVRFSNTFLFYERGWSGINIDAMPGSMRQFAALRPRDVNIECGVGTTTRAIEFFEFNEGALNTFSPLVAAERDGIDGHHVVRRHLVKTRPLSQILDEHLPARLGTRFDFLTIDAEGTDLDVLRSNDWTKFRPEFVLVETLGASFREVLESDIAAALDREGYEPFAKTLNTCFFREHGAK